VKNKAKNHGFWVLFLNNIAEAKKPVYKINLQQPYSTGLLSDIIAAQWYHGHNGNGILSHPSAHQFLAIKIKGLIYLDHILNIGHTPPRLFGKIANAMVKYKYFSLEMWMN
jgi:hypothetical protein